MKFKIKNKLALNLTFWLLLGVTIVSSGFYFVINMQTKDMQKRFFDKTRLFSSILGANLDKIVGDNLLAYRELQEATSLVKKTRKEIEEVRIIAPELTILSASSAKRVWRPIKEEYRHIVNDVIRKKEPKSIVKTAPDKEEVIHFMPLFEGASHKLIGVMQVTVRFPSSSGQVAVSLRTNKTSYFRKEASDISINLAKSLSHFLNEAQRNFEYLENLIKNMVTDEEVHDVKIFSRDSKILISGSLKRGRDIFSDRDNSLYKKAMDEQKVLISEESHKGLMEVISPLYLRKNNNKEIGGAVDIVFSLNRLNSLVSQRRNNILIMSIAIIGMFCLIIVLFFKIKVLNPLAEIILLINKVSGGDFSFRARVSSYDEIGMLTEAFNSMLEELQKYKEKVEQLNLKLKDKVDKVTEELKEKQTQLLESEKLASLGILSSGIAHQINNPLGIILGNTQMLLRKLRQDVSLEPKDIQELLTAVEENARRCSHIVDSLLQFGRRKKPRFQETDVAEVINRALEFTSSHLSKKEINIVRDFTLPLYSQADPIQLEQVFINIIINSEQSLEKNGQIEIKSEIRNYNERKFVFITFQDNGRGISKDNLSKIFDPFFSTKEPGQGSGLGLSISYGIIKSHGGEIEINSKPGEGTTVIVKLPIKSQD